MSKPKIVQAALLLLFFPGLASATIIDLGHPTLTSSITSNVALERGIVFDVSSALSIDFAGIVLDPLASSGATSLTAEIYERNFAIPGNRGALLQSASGAITDAGLSFYDVAISFTFLPGTLYELVFHDGSDGWTFGGNNFEFWNFDFPDAAYGVGPVTVYDGTQGPTGSSFNTIMMHFRLGQTMVPEPGTIALLGLGLVGLRLRRR